MPAAHRPATGRDVRYKQYGQFMRTRVLVEVLRRKNQHGVLHRPGLVRGAQNAVAVFLEEVDDLIDADRVSA